MKQTFLITAFALLVFSAFTFQSAIDISILSPTEKKEYNTLDTIFIKAKVSSNSELHNVNVKVISVDDNMVLFSKNIHSHGSVVNVNEFFINPLKDKKAMKLTIQTSGHDEQVTASKDLLFSSKKSKKGK